MNLFLFRKKDPRKACFLSGWGGTYSDNARHLFEHCVDNIPGEFHYIITAERIDDMRKAHPKYADRFIAFEDRSSYRHILTSSTIFITHGLGALGHIHLARGKVKVVFLNHSIEYSHDSYYATYRDDPEKRAILRQVRRHDHILVTSRFQSTLFSAKFGVPADRMVIAEFPRNIHLLGTHDGEGPGSDDMSGVDLEADEFRILYAPTLRLGPGKVFFNFEDADLTRLDSFLVDRKIRLLIRPHRDEKDIDIDFDSYENISDYCYDKVEDISTRLSRMDAIMTDYSTIFMDYLLLDRPIIFVDSDRELYESKVPFCFEFDLLAAGARITSQEGLMEHLGDIRDGNDHYSDHRSFIRRIFHEGDHHTAMDTILSKIGFPDGRKP